MKPLLFALGFFAGLCGLELQTFAQDGGAPQDADAGVLRTEGQAQVVAPDASVETETARPLPSVQTPPSRRASPPASALPASDEAIYTLDELTIEGTVDAASPIGTTTYLDERQLSSFRLDDPTVVVQQAPGVYVRPEDGFGLRPNIGIRGVASDRSKKITLLEDDVLFGPAPYSAPAAYYFPVMARIVSVEVHKGPALLQYGPQNIGGALDLQTRDFPTQPQGAAELTYGRFASRRLHFHYGTSVGWGGVLIEGVDLGSEGFKQLDGDPNANTGFSRQEVVLRGMLQTPTERATYHQLELRLGYSRERSHETYLGLSDADFAANPLRRYASSALDRMTWWRTQVQLRYRGELDSHIKVKAVAYRHDFDRTWRRLDRFRQGPNVLDVLANPTASRELYYNVLTGTEDSPSLTDPTQNQTDLMIVSNARRFVSQGVQGRLQFNFNTGLFAHDIEVGLRFHHDSIDRDHVLRGYRMLAGSLVSDSAAPNPVDDNLGSTFAMAAHAMYSLKWRDITVMPILRSEWTRSSLDNDLTNVSVDRTDVVLLPGVGVSYRVVPWLTVLGGVHRGFSPVTPGQAKEVTPELSVNYEVGGRAQLEETNTSAELVGFFNDYSNLVGECGGSSGCPSALVDRQFNGGEVDVWGVEAQATQSIPLGFRLRLALRAAYTFMHATFRTSFDSENPEFGEVNRGDEVPYLPKHQGLLQMGLKQEDDAWDLNVGATYVGPMREQAGQGEPEPGELPKTDSYVLVNVGATYRVFRHVRVLANVQNLLNQSAIVARRPFGARPLAPWIAELGVRAEL